MKKVVQDLTSAGLLGVWGKWVKHAKYIAAGDTAKGGTIVNAFLSWEDTRQQADKSIICRKEVITKEQFIDLIQDATVQILF